MKFQEAQQYLQSFINYEYHLKEISSSIFDLKRMEYLLELLDNPHKGLAFIHVAGSKGKGSVCAMTANILSEAGYRVGLYTSPHLYSWRERIRIVNLKKAVSSEIFPDVISEEECSDILEEMHPFLEKIRMTKELGELSYFEVLTALAFCYFKKNQVDLVVLETGLGGRLDATNVVSSLVCVLTPISLEHTALLGDTTIKIAHEKAAIVKKRNVKVIVAEQERDVRMVIEKRCQQFGASPLWIGQDIQYQLKSQGLDGQIFDVYSSDRKVEYLQVPLSLLGRHQLMNAASAMGVVLSLQDLGFFISRDAVFNGFKNVFWPGRFEMIHKNPLIIIDGAHNGYSARCLAETMQEMFPKQRIVVILGVSSDKDRRVIIEELKHIAKKFILTKTDHPRSHDWNFKEMKEYFLGMDCVRTACVKEAMELALAGAQRSDIILVSGSLFLTAEARKSLSNQ